MKRLMFVFVLLPGLYSASAQKSIEATAEIKSATIYLQGAEMQLRSSVNLPSGNSNIVFTGLPQNVNASTVQVSASTDLTILSAVFALNYLQTKKESAQGKLYSDSLTTDSLQLRKVIGQKNIVKGQMDLLNANKDVSGANTGLNMDQLTKMYAFYATKMNDLNTQMIELEQREKELRERLLRMQNQVNEMNAKFNQPSGEITVSVSARAAQSSTFAISFLIPDAGWSAIYDARSSDVKSPVTLNYKAQVWQSSGTDWNDIKVKLSTGNPAMGSTGPQFNPWFIDFNVPRPLGQVESDRMLKSEPAPAAEGSAVYKSNSLSGADFTSVNQTQLTAEFDISIPYTVPSDGKPHLISIQDYKLPATYSYYAIPRMDNDAFLTADISSWEDLNLLPGNANIFFEGSYVGQSYLDPASTKDTLSISLGRDKNIVIKREKVKDFSKEKIIGDNKRQSFAYTISIKNLKNEEVDIKIIDQYPISQQGKIEVTLDEPGGAAVDASTGQLTWRLHLEKSEEKKVQFSFTVKYPKDQWISGL